MPWYEKFYLFIEEFLKEVVVAAYRLFKGVFDSLEPIISKQLNKIKVLPFFKVKNFLITTALVLFPLFWVRGLIMSMTKTTGEVSWMKIGLWVLGITVVFLIGYFGYKKYQKGARPSFGWLKPFGQFVFVVVGALVIYIFIADTIKDGKENMISYQREHGIRAAESCTNNPWIEGCFPLDTSFVHVVRRGKTDTVFVPLYYQIDWIGEDETCNNFVSWRGRRLENSLLLRHFETVPGIDSTLVFIRLTKIRSDTPEPVTNCKDTPPPSNNVRQNNESPRVIAGAVSFLCFSYLRSFERCLLEDRLEFEFRRYPRLSL